MRGILSIMMVLVVNVSLLAQTKEDSPGWFDKIQIGGYLQVRYNGIFESNPQLECEQCDENWGEQGNGFSFRRIRFKIKGQISPRVFFYFQPDFAKSIGGSHHVGQLKDAYIDLGLDRLNEFRLRIGQSKVPFGYENMQSSSNRLPLDRNDALNSAVKDERDLGVFLYWAPTEKRDMIHGFRKAGLSGGDFGLFALGIYNGQTANQSDENDKFHLVTRFTYPLVLGKQVIEPGIQAYTGTYVVTSHHPEIEVDAQGYLDQRAALSFVLYPNPIGIQAEYNVGRGPEFDRYTNSVRVKHLQGGYATLSYYIEKGNQYFFPYFRIQYYDGGKKHENDARSYTVKEAEFGVEWHPFKNFELVANYTLSDRRFEDYANPVNTQRGGLMRIQAQVKF